MTRSKLWSAPVLVTALAALVCTVLLCAGVWYSFNSWGSQLDPNHTSREQVAAKESALRAGGPAEQEAGRVEAALGRVADSVVALEPRVSWRWGSQSTPTLSCDPYQMFPQNEPVQIGLRNLVFEGAVTERTRGRIIAALTAQAEGLGLPQEAESFADSYGRSWARFAKGSDSVSISLVSGLAATGAPEDLIAKENAPAVVVSHASCLFPQQYATGRRAPGPAAPAPSR